MKRQHVWAICICFLISAGFSAASIYCGLRAIHYAKLAQYYSCVGTSK